MHRPLVPRIHAKSNETQGNAAKIVFVDLNGWQHSRTLSSANKRLPRACEFTVTRMHISEARLRSILQSLTSRCDAYDEAGNVIETHEQTLRRGLP
jgi:hypothetical protein